MTASFPWEASGKPAYGGQALGPLHLIIVYGHASMRAIYGGTSIPLTRLGAVYIVLCNQAGCQPGSVVIVDDGDTTEPQECASYCFLRG
jgi:hypothetical protein